MTGSTCMNRRTGTTSGGLETLCTILPSREDGNKRAISAACNLSTAANPCIRSIRNEQGGRDALAHVLIPDEDVPAANNGGVALPWPLHITFHTHHSGEFKVRACASHRDALPVLQHVHLPHPIHRHRTLPTAQSTKMDQATACGHLPIHCETQSLSPATGTSRFATAYPR